MDVDEEDEQPEPAPLPKPAAKAKKPLTEEQKQKRKEREALLKQQKKAAAAAAGDAVIEQPKKSEAQSKKNKTHPTDAEQDTDAPPTKKSKKDSDAPTAPVSKPKNKKKDAAPPHPLSVDGPTWAMDTKLKWPGLPVTLVVNDVFRVLVSFPPSGHDNGNLVKLYRELFALENDMDVLFRWGAVRVNEFIAIMHLLQILTPRNTTSTPKPAESSVSSSMANRLTKMLAERGILNQEISLARYVTKPETEYRALPGLIQISRDLVNEEEEPYGGKPMHDFLTGSLTKDINRFNNAFVSNAEDPKKGQQQVTLVACAFKALFY